MLLQGRCLTDLQCYRLIKTNHKHHVIGRGGWGPADPQNILKRGSFHVTGCNTAAAQRRMHNRLSCSIMHISNYDKKHSNDLSTTNSQLQTFLDFTMQVQLVKKQLKNVKMTESIGRFKLPFEAPRILIVFYSECPSASW